MSEENTKNLQKEKKVNSAERADKLILNSSTMIANALKTSTLHSSAIAEVMKSAPILNYSTMIADALKTSTLHSSTIAEVMRSAPILNSSTMIADALKTSTLHSSAIAEVMKSAPILNYSTMIADALKTVSISKELGFDNWAKLNTQIYSAINERISRVQQIDSNILPTLKRYNWFTTVSLDDDFISDLSQVIENSSGKLGITLRHEFINYFSKSDFVNLMAMVEGWGDNPLFKPRMRIFQDCIRLLKYNNGRYNPSIFLIPTLISQIDGILTAYLIQNEFTFVKHNNRLGWMDKNTKFDQSRNNIYKKIFDSSVQDYSFIDAPTSFEFLEVGGEFILNTLFQTAYPTQKLKKPFGLSRHKIMHGEYLRYGRKDHLYRSFLILDFLYGLMDVDCN